MGTGRALSRDRRVSLGRRAPAHAGRDARRNGEGHPLASGESDANPTNAPLYEDRLRALIARFRAELGNPSLPFLIGQLGRFSARPWNESFEQVDAAHRRVAAEVANVAFVPSEGLADNGDNLHFNADGARELGRRYANSYLKLTVKP